MALAPEAYAKAQSNIAKAAIEEFARRLNILGSNPGQALVFAVFDEVAQRYGPASAELAADFYMDRRGEIPGLSNYQAQPVTRVHSTWHDIQRFERFNPDDILRSLAPILGSRVQLFGRDTIKRNTRNDGAAWARMPVGKTCSWCLMLASRGAAYFSRESAQFVGGTSDTYHADCDCQPVPVWRNQDLPYDADALFDFYLVSRKHVESEVPASTMITDRMVAKRMRIDWADLLSDGAA